jgi:hypothetical protein
MHTLANAVAMPPKLEFDQMKGLTLYRKNDAKREDE